MHLIINQLHTPRVSREGVPLDHPKLVSMQKRREIDDLCEELFYVNQDRPARKPSRQSYFSHFLLYLLNDFHSNRTS